MNWQSDFVSPHLITNGQSYIQSQNTPSQKTTNLMPISQVVGSPVTNATGLQQANAYIQNSSNYSQGRYISSNTPSLITQYGMMANNNPHYSHQASTQTHQHAYIAATVPQHLGNTTQAVNSKKVSYQTQSTSPGSDRTKGMSSSNSSGNHYQMPIAHVSVAPTTSSSTYSMSYTNPNTTNTSTKPLNNPSAYMTSNSNNNQKPISQQYQHQQYQQSSNKNLTIKIIESLRRNNLKVIAFDFDCTIVNIHTGGQWCDSAEKLAEFVRPCFRELIPALLKCPDFFVCVTTYSPQEDLIREVLRIMMKDEFAVNDLVNKVIIKGNTREFVEEHGIENCYSNGKQIHLAFCREFFESLIRKFNKENSHNFKINNDNILLIDDDLQNLKIAYENGHLAFQVNSSIQLVDFYNFLDEI